LNRSSPSDRVERTLSSIMSSWSSSAGIQAQPCSVSTKRSPGNRSNTPDSSRKMNGRRE
jgi:hypothetical protein